MLNIGRMKFRRTNGRQRFRVRLWLPLLGCLSLCFVTAARADLCDQAIAIQVRPAGLRFLSDWVRDVIPATISLAPISAVVVDWPLTDADARLEMNEVPGAVAVRQLEFDQVGAALRMTAVVDVNVSAPATVYNAYVGIGTAHCQADAQLRSIRLQADFRLSTQAGQIRVTADRTQATVDSSQHSVALRGCALGNIYAAVSGMLGEESQIGSQAWLEAFARDKVPLLVQDWLNEHLQTSRDVPPVRYVIRLDGVDTQASGIVARFGADVQPLQGGQPACLQGATFAPPGSCKPVAQVPDGAVDAMFTASVSQGLINRTFDAIWRAGYLCIDSRTVDVPILRQSLARLATALGLPAGTNLWFRVRPLTVPQVNLTAESGMELVLHQFDLTLGIEPPGGPNGGFGVEADIAISVTPTIDAATNSIGLDLRHVQVTRLDVHERDGAIAALTLDPARVQRFISDVALPVMRGQLDKTQLSPSILNVQNYAIELKQLELSDGQLTTYVDAFDRRTIVADQVPPETRLLETPPAVVGPQVLTLRVAGTDATTPAALLRFRTRIDGGQWTDPQYGGRVDVVTYGGTHRIEIAAVDLQDNTDPTPVVIDLVVDDVPPHLDITARPDALINNGRFSVAFVGSDDRTPTQNLTYTVELLRVPEEGGVPELVQSQDFAAGTTSAQFAGLRAGVYKVRVIVRDAAGNVTSEDIGALVEDTGCSLAHGGRRPSGPILLWLLLVLLGRVRRSCRG